MRELRVFLCDDDDGYRTLVRTVLSEDGMEIVGEGDGPDCVRAVEEAVPDIVLLDLNMPGMNGFEALAQLRGRSPSVKVIILSTARDQTSESAARRLGADGFISKPLRIFDLPDLLREALSGGEARDDRGRQAADCRAK